MMSCRQFSKSFSSLKYLLLIREKGREDSALPSEKENCLEKRQVFSEFHLG